ncbi:MAG: putative photosynthetic complex assembly protein PuhE [Sedimentitalea sp.]
MTGMLWITALFALFVWWFSTGVILLVVRRADRIGGHAHRLAVVGGLPVLAAGITGLAHSVTDTSVTGAYIGFLSALAIWGWAELSFLTGFIAGPNKTPCAPDARGIDRLRSAWNTIVHHELLLLMGLLLLVVASTGASNQIAMWTYLVLFGARILAKLNLFFGVPRINTEFVPRPLDHMTSYFRKGPVTLAFPLAITLLSFALACLMHQLWTETDPARLVGFALLGSLTALALLEHWLMVLPLPDAKLWRWMLPAPATPKPRYAPTHNKN